MDTNTNPGSIASQSRTVNARHLRAYGVGAVKAPTAPTARDRIRAATLPGAREITHRAVRAQIQAMALAGNVAAQAALRGWK